ncbi:aminoacyl-tRNA hydrolase [bacterium]|nr:aminoacyl-tRNA hydrolase [bacterium]
MKLIVGLGNVGEKYAETRHNFGFLAIDRLAKKFEFSPWKLEKKFFGFVASGQIFTEKVLFLKPTTLMNLSGKSVAAAMNFYKLSPADLVIFSDDLDSKFGDVRWKSRGGSGGHNGFRSIFSAIGTEDFPRLKFGISNLLREKIPGENFVLQKFSADEFSQIPEILDAGFVKFLENFKC